MLIMLSSSKCKAWDGSIRELEISIREIHRHRDQARLELLDKQIAEEEASYRLKQEQLQLKKAALIAEEESGRKDFEAIRAEKAAMQTQREKLKPTIQQLNLFARIQGPHLISYFGVDYKQKGGRVYCPEGKVCVSKTQSEEECDYWTCPLIISMSSTSPNPNPVVGATAMMTQLEISQMSTN